MKIVSKITAVFLFILFFGFALKNTQYTALHFFWNYELRGPLILFLLGFLIGGAVLGVLAMMPTVFHYRRELAKYKKNVQTLQQECAEQQEIRDQPPQPDTFVTK